MRIKSEKLNGMPSYTVDSEDDKTNIKIKREPVDPKVISKIQKIGKKQYFEENNYKEIKPHGVDNQYAEYIENFDISEYDAWIVHCPKQINPTVLVDKGIKMPGRRYVDDLQVRTNAYTNPIGQTIGYVSERQKYKITNIPVSGIVMISKRLKQNTAADEETNQEKPTHCKPKNLRLSVRHPFFGRNYKSRVELDSRLNKRLRKAETTSAQVSSELRKTANFYEIRKALKNTAQSLADKELLVRQSVVTGVRPKFMDDSLHPNYVSTLNASTEKSVANLSDEVSVKPKKKKPNTTGEEYELANNSQLKTKTKKKKHSTNEDIQIDLTDETFKKFQDVREREKEKKNKSQTKKIKLLTNANDSIDLTVEDVPPKRSKKNKEHTTDISSNNENLTNGEDIQLRQFLHNVNKLATSQKSKR